MREMWRWIVRHQAGWLMLHDWWIDRRFGGWCGGVIASPFAARGATRTESGDYQTFARLFSHPLVGIGASDVLVDVGCGKGRVINQWLRSGFRNRIVGLELTPAVGEWTKARLARFENVEIIVGDAIETFPAAGTVFFLFNPFGRETMEEFARQLTLRVDTKALRIVYLNARQMDVFDRASWDVRELETGSPDTAFLIRHVHGVSAGSRS